MFNVGVLKQHSRNFVYVFAIIALLVSLFAPYSYLLAEANLISNSSMEIAESPSKPTSWTANSWGNNTTAFSYVDNGYLSNKSLQIAMNSRLDGDAKWMHDPVSVSAGTQYMYSGYYKSNTATEIDVQYANSSGNISYVYIGYVPASTEWANINFTFTAPSDAVKAVVMHVIASVGTVQIDSVNFAVKSVIPAPNPTPAPDPTPITPSTNIITNGNVEQGTSKAPTSWNTSKTGTNRTTFSYISNGYQASKSISISMMSRASGSAKWMHSAATVTPGKVYTYSSYYKSTVITELVVQYIAINGTITYQTLQNVPVASSWSSLITEFTVPATATKVIVMQQISKVGNLQSDNHSLIQKTTTPIDPVVPPTDPVFPPVQGNNLVANPSFETASGTIPSNWQSNSWGTNSSVFTYESTGRSGSKSVTTTTTSYTNGDAKWFADPITVNAGELYEYSDYFKATSQTRVVVALINAAGTYSYIELSPAPASANTWTLYKASFLVPNGISKVSIYHILDSNGKLTLDDVSLIKVPAITPPPVSQSVIPNNSLEIASSTFTAPLSWQNNSWGTNSTAFDYVSEGQEGSKSVKVTVSNYQSGDAKWYFNPLNNLTPGSQYKFSAWYKTNIKTPKVVAMYTDINGLTSYVGLPNAVPNGTVNWQLYNATFLVPANTVSTSIFMLVSENGWLQTDNYNIVPYSPTGFSRPLLTLTFDDGHEDNVNTALPLLNQYGFKTTQCFATTFLEGLPFVTSNIKAFYDTGHEICSHSVTHPFLTQATDANLAYELSHSKQFLESVINSPVRNFASPYGDYDTRVINEISKYYQSHRSVDVGFNSKDNFDIYRLRVQNVLDTTTAAEVSTWIQKAQADKTWLILVYHRVASNPGRYDTYTDVFKQHLDTIKSSGITVKTYQDALSEITPQF